MPTEVLIEVIGGPKVVAPIEPSLSLAEVAAVAAAAVGKSLLNEDGTEKAWKLFAPTLAGGFSPTKPDTDLQAVAEKMLALKDSGDDGGFAGPGEHEGSAYLFRLRLFVPGKPPPRADLDSTAPISDEEAIDLTNMEMPARKPGRARKAPSEDGSSIRRTGGAKKRATKGGVKPGSTGRIKKPGKNGGTGRIKKPGKRGGTGRIKKPGRRTTGGRAKATGTAGPGLTPMPERPGFGDGDSGKTAVARPPQGAQSAVPGIIPSTAPLGPSATPLPTPRADASARVLSTAPLSGDGPVPGARALTRSGLAPEPLAAAVAGVRKTGGGVRKSGGAARRTGGARQSVRATHGSGKIGHKTGARNAGGAKHKVSKKASKTRVNPGILVLVAVLVIGLFLIIGLALSHKGGQLPGPPSESPTQRLSDVVRISPYPDPAGLGTADPVFALVARFNELGANAPSQLESPAIREAVRGLEREIEAICRKTQRFDACDGWARMSFSAYQACYGGDCGGEAAAGYFVHSIEGGELAFQAARELKDQAAKTDASHRLASHAVRLAGTNLQIIKSRAPTLAKIAERSCSGGFKDVPDCASVTP